jgi:hypothetical protein
MIHHFILTASFMAARQTSTARRAMLMQQGHEALKLLAQYRGQKNTSIRVVIFVRCTEVFCKTFI